MLGASLLLVEPANAQLELEPHKPFEALSSTEEADRFGSDAIGLQSLGLLVNQELSPRFAANDLQYQVVAHYAGSGWSVKQAPCGNPCLDRQYLWFTPTTQWGPLGAGWNVHMGKLLSTGLIEPTYYNGSAIERGFTDSCTSVPLCDEYGPVRWVNNSILTSNGQLHPAGAYCRPDLFPSPDYHWVKTAEVVPSLCQAIRSFRTPDGTLYELNQYRLVERITDLSGNRVEISYYDPQTLAQERDCTTDPSWCNYETTLQDVDFWGPSGELPTHEAMIPIKRIQDSNGRRVDFVLTTVAYGGKYRIAEVRSASPSGTQAIYRMSYEERDVTNYVNGAPPEFWGSQTPPLACDSGGSLKSCLAPQLDGISRNQVIERVAFLVKVEMPDTSTVEYDYYPWGDLKSIRTVNGGTIDYKWNYWKRPSGYLPLYPDATVAGTGIKVASRRVRPRTGDPVQGTHEWRFEKNFLPEKLDGWDIFDQDRTIVTTPEGNEVVYRFNEAGLVRNVKTYVGTAFRWVQGITDATETNVASPPDGKLLREIERWTEHGNENITITRLMKKNPGGEGTTVSPLQSPRTTQEEIYYFDDPIGTSPPDLTGNWRYDIQGPNTANYQGTRIDPKTTYNSVSWALQGWQRQRGYRIEVLEGSALGFRKTRERKFTTFDQLTTEEALAESLGFRWPIAWVRERQVWGPSGNEKVSESLVEYQYDTAQVHKIIKEVRRKNAAAVTAPNDHPYALHPGGGTGDVTISYELWPARSTSLALPSAPVPTAYGLPSRMIRSGGDPPTTVESTPGDSGVVYDETLTYQYGVLSSRQAVEDLSWKSVDRDVSVSGHVSLVRDSAAVPTLLKQDVAGDLEKVWPGGEGSAEYPIHIEKDLRSALAENGEFKFPAGRKLYARTVWRGPDGAAYRTDSRCSYLQTDLDGLGRAVRYERKLADGSLAERRLEYGVLLGDGVHRGGMDQVTREEEWVVQGATTRPATSRFLTFDGTSLQGRLDPFVRFWKIVAPDNATRFLRHFGTSHEETLKAVKGTAGDIDSVTAYYRDAFGWLRILDGPAGAADAVYEYDQFSNVVKANLVPQVQLSPRSDTTTGLYTDRFAVSNGDGQVRSFVFDGLGRLREASNPENGVVHYHAYDPIERLLLSDDENGVILRRRYDPAGRLTQVEQCAPVEPNVECEASTPGNVLTELIYHNSSATPLRGQSLGKLLTLKGYDDARNLLSQQEFYYSELNGRLSEMRTAYRDWQPGTTIEGATSPFYSIDYSYTDEGALKDVTYPHPVGYTATATQVSYGYIHGWLNAVGSNRSIGASVAFHPSGLLKQLGHSGGSRTLIDSDNRGRVANIEVRTYSGSSLWKTGTHRYDGGGNIYEIGDSTLPADDYWKFAYDQSQRLVRAQLAGYEISYGYDPYGNITSQMFLTAPSPPPPGMAFQGRSYRNAAGVETNQVQDPTYGYDGNGDLRDAEGLGYDYDVRSRLTAVGTVDGSGLLIPNGVYRYSGAGLRASKEDRTTSWTTFYFRDVSGEVLSEFARPNAGGAPAWSRDYVYGAGRHLGVVENGPPSTPGGFATCAQAGSRTCEQAAGSGAITLDWASNPDADIYGYRVYRGSSPEQFDPASGQTPPARVHAGEVTSSFFADLTSKSCTAASGQHCWYAVTAVDRSGKEGAFSTPLAIQLDDITPPAVPQQVRVDGTSQTTVNLSWRAETNPPVDLLGYYVYRSTQSGDSNPQLLNGVPIGGTALSDVGLLCETTYYYRVKSVDTARNLSAYSSEVTATTGDCGSGSCPPGGCSKKRTDLDLSDPEFEDGDSAPVVGIAELVEDEGGKAAGITPEAGALDGPAAADVTLDAALEPSPHQTVGQSGLDWVAYNLHTDHLGSIRLVTNMAEQVVARHRYFPFGQEVGPITKSPSPHRYIGREWDAESGLLHLMARYATPKTGARFNTVDLLAGTVWSGASLNRYAYGFNSPLRYLDPYGLTGKIPDDDNTCPPGATCITVVGEMPGGGSNLGGGGGAGGTSGSSDGAKSSSTTGSTSPTGAATGGTLTAGSTSGTGGESGAGATTADPTPGQQVALWAAAGIMLVISGETANLLLEYGLPAVYVAAAAGTLTPVGATVLATVIVVDAVVILAVGVYGANQAANAAAGN